MKQKKLFLISLLILSGLQVGCSNLSETMQAYQDIQVQSAEVLYKSALLDMKMKKYERAADSLV